MASKKTTWVIMMPPEGRSVCQVLRGAARDNVVAMIAGYEKMAAALDTIAPADRAHPRHPTI